ncbi:MAG: hypothetical protein M3295_05485, partial [Chloroflexota bacterium]|nr:hypothetical protein [Chloroflexota bacterium]
MYDIVGKRRWYFAFSLAITIPGLVFIALGGLRPSIDFTGGTVWQVRYADRPSADDVRLALASLAHPDGIVTTLDDGFLQIRTDPIDLLPPQTPPPSASVAPSPSGTAPASPSASPASGAPTPAPSA